VYYVIAMRVDIRPTCPSKLKGEPHFANRVNCRGCWRSSSSITSNNAKPCLTKVSHEADPGARRTVIFGDLITADSRGMRTRRDVAASTMIARPLQMTFSSKREGNDAREQLLPRAQGRGTGECDGS